MRKFLFAVLLLMATTPLRLVSDGHGTTEKTARLLEDFQVSVLPVDITLGIHPDFGSAQEIEFKQAVLRRMLELIVFRVRFEHVGNSPMAEFVIPSDFHEFVFLRHPGSHLIKATGLADDHELPLTVDQSNKSEVVNVVFPSETESGDDILQHDSIELIIEGLGDEEVTFGFLLPFDESHRYNYRETVGILKELGIWAQIEELRRKYMPR